MGIDKGWALLYISHVHRTTIGSRAVDDLGETPPADAREQKHAKKAERGLDTRVLDPWERYRALIDLVEQYTDYVELCDRKTRFALLIMSALNAVNLLLAARPDLVNADRASLGPIVRFYVLTYGIVSLYCFMHAISVLRPRQWLVDTVNNNPRGLRFMKVIAEQSPQQFRDNWRTATAGQLWEETATHAQQMARISAAKYRALDRVFQGLLAMTVLTTIFLATLAVASAN